MRRSRTVTDPRTPRRLVGAPGGKATRPAVEWTDALPEYELPEGSMFGVQVGGEPVLLVHLLGGGVRAYQGRCPHDEMDLADAAADPLTARLGCCRPEWTFDLVSGSAAGMRLTLYAYPVEVVKGRIRVGIPQDGQPHVTRVD